MLDSQRDYPSLSHANARVRRAKSHLTNFKRQSTKFLDNSDAMGYFDYRFEGEFFVVDFEYVEVSEILPILASEVIYNLRSALDYLVYEMSVLDFHGQVEEKIPQFVIEDRPGGWRKNKSRLRFLNDLHQARIKELQPFKGCQWTGRLRDLSNPDKHRSLHLLRLHTSEWWSDAGQAEPITSDIEDMPADTQLIIAFSDGSPVEETLKELIDNVTSVLADFESEF